MLRWCRWDAANCRQNHSLGIIRICPQPLKWVAGLEKLAVSLKRYPHTKMPYDPIRNNP
jgi:hypothetical protein